MLSTEGNGGNVSDEEMVTVFKKGCGRRKFAELGL